MVVWQLKTSTYTIVSLDSRELINKSRRIELKLHPMLLRVLVISNLVVFTSKEREKCKPPVRIELTTPGLQDQCSTTELWRQI